MVFLPLRFPPRSSWYDAIPRNSIPAAAFFSWTPDHRRVSSDRSDVVVVVVVVADGDDVRLRLREGVADGLVEGVGDNDLSAVRLDLETGVA